MKIGRNDPCWCGSGVKYKKCHEAFDGKLERLHQEGAAIPDRRMIKTPGQIERIRESCKINIEILDYVQDHIGPGITTQQIDDWVSSITLSHGAVPAPLHFEGYPKNVCTSIDEVVCHGIPDDRTVLKEGDIVNVDVSTNLNGWFSDSSRMFLIGEVSEEKRRLVDTTRQCMQAGIEQVKPWTPIGNMSHAVHQCALDAGYSVVREIGGHGIGIQFHEDPWVSYTAAQGTGILMVPGMMFTIEPMVNMGGPVIWADKKDGWTVRTKDGLPSAQWEVTVLVTDDGCEVITW